MTICTDPSAASLEELIFLKGQIVIKTVRFNVHLWCLWFVFMFLLAVLNQERTIHNIEEFDKSKLKHAETEVKNPLPDKSGEIWLEQFDVV